MSVTVPLKGFFFFFPWTRPTSAMTYVNLCIYVLNYQFNKKVHFFVIFQLLPASFIWSFSLFVCFGKNPSVSLTCVTISVAYFCLTRFLQNTSKADSPALPSSSGQSSHLSPTPGAEFPKAAKMSTPQRPRLGTGFSEGEDILFFDGPPPPAPKLGSLAEAKKVTVLQMGGFWVWRRGG